jgi:hypothetical protein
MTFYEVIISSDAEPKSLVISGLGNLLMAIRFLDEAAKRGDIIGWDEVNVFDDVPVPGALLQGLLNDLEQDPSWVDLSTFYRIYLSEV